MFVHHVFFWMHPNSNQDQRDALHAGLMSLSKIESVRTFHVGVPAETRRPVIDASYQFSLLTIFDTAAQEAAYQIDPIHLAFVANHKHLWERVVVYDSL